MNLAKVGLVARWEFLSAITRRTYIFAVVAMPVFYGIMLVTAGVAGRAVARSESARPIAIVDKAHVIDFAAAQEAAEARSAAESSGGVPQLTPPQALTPYDDFDRAFADLVTRKVAAVYVVEPDYVTSGRMTSYGTESGLMSVSAERRRQNQVAEAIRASLAHRALTGDLLTRAYTPASNVTRLHVNGRGDVSAQPEDAGGPFAGTFGIFFMLTMAIFFSAGFLQQATMEDRQNRMIEILLSSLDTDEIVIGKIVGLSGAGLLQVAIYLVLLIVPGVMVLAIVQVPLAKLALSLVYFVLGYVLFASLMAATGMIGRTAQESAQLSAIWTLTSASPMFFLAAISTAPNGLLARALSFFPLTGPVTMMMRLGSGDIPPVDVIVSIAIGLAAVYLTLRAASKILRAA
jgi:ABC-2 type transport system permease protein